MRPLDCRAVVDISIALTVLGVAILSVFGVGYAVR
jgi:hypothetical protein